MLHRQLLILQSLTSLLFCAPIAPNALNATLSRQDPVNVVEGLHTYHPPSSVGKGTLDWRVEKASPIIALTCSSWDMKTQICIRARRSAQPSLTCPEYKPQDLLDKVWTQLACLHYRAEIRHDANMSRHASARSDTCIRIGEHGTHIIWRK